MVGNTFVKEAATFEEAALACGSTREEIMVWHARLASLRIDTIQREDATQDGTRFSYIEFGFFPVMAPYGFRYAPPTDPVALRELRAMAVHKRRPGLEMRDLGDGWFYFEGVWTWQDVPFKRER